MSDDRHWAPAYAGATTQKPRRTGLRISACDAVKKMSEQAEKEARMFEPKASCRASRLLAHLFGNPEGAAALRSPFFAYFLWRDKESKRLPGRPRLVTTE